MNNNPLTLEAILVLDAIASRGSFAAAAEHLGKVPSALSYIVQKLEQQLAVTVFVRQGRRSVFTPAGKHLLEEGRKVLTAVSKITEQTQTLAHGWEPKIRLAYDSIVDVAPILAVLNAFLLEYPNIEIDLCEHVMHGAWEVLLDDKVDLLIAGAPPVPIQAGLRSEKLIQMQEVLMASSQHELAYISQPINRADISDYRTVIVHDSAALLVPWSSNLISQSRHFFVSSVEQKIKSIEAGIGIGFLPVERVRNQLEKGSLVKVATQQRPETVDFYLAWKTVSKGKGLARLREMLHLHYVNA